MYYLPGRVYFHGKKLQAYYSSKGYKQRAYARHLGIDRGSLRDYVNEQRGCQEGNFLTLLGDIGWGKIIPMIKAGMPTAKEIYDKNRPKNLDWPEIQFPEEEGVQYFTYDKLEKLQITKEMDIGYKEHFNSVSKLYSEEFKQFKYWIEIEAIRKLNEEYIGIRKEVTIIIQDNINSGKNVVFFGDSGWGKTFSFLKSFKDMTEKKKYINEDLLNNNPLFIELDNIKYKNQEEALQKEIEKFGLINEKNKCVFFLDGLNDVGDFEKQKEIFRQINRYSIINPEIRFFINTQTIEDFEIESSNFVSYEIQSLTDYAIIKYLMQFSDIFYTNEKTKIFCDTLPEYLKELISIPIFLYILVSTLKKDRLAVAKNPGKLVEKYEDFIFGSRGNLRPNLRKEYRNEVIPFIAFNMCKEKNKGVTNKIFNKYVHDYNHDNSSTINEAILKDSMIYKFKIIRQDKNGILMFTHDILRDYFAAVHINNSKLNPNEIPELVFPINPGKNEKMAHTIRYLVGIITPVLSRIVIQNFIEKNAYYACELFAWSSILTYDEKLILKMYKTIDIDKKEYLINLNYILAFYLKVLDILQNAGKYNYPITADFLLSAGTILAKKANHDKAINYYEKAILIFEKNNMQEQPDYARCMTNIGNAFNSRLEYDKAINYYEKAILIFERNNMQEHPDYALCLMNLGNVFNDKKDYDKAIKYYKSTISILEKNNMQEHPDYALCLMNLGNVFNEKRDYDKAINYYEKATHIFKTNNRENHHDYALCLTNLGRAYSDKSEFDKALNFFEKAGLILNNINMLDHPYYALTIFSIGNVYGKKLEYNEAIKLYKKAIQIYTNNKMENQSNYKKVLYNLGISYFIKGENEKSLEYLELALNILKDTKGKDNYYKLCLESINEIKSETTKT